MPRPAREVHAGIPGDKEYEAKVGKLRASLYDSIPANLRLPSSILDDLPVNVLDVASTCGLLSKEELAITELDATDVRDKIASGQLSAVEVVSAIGKRAVIGHQVTGCLTEIFLDEGIARAKELDEHYKKTGTVW
jgi:amidase